MAKITFKTALVLAFVMVMLTLSIRVAYAYFTDYDHMLGAASLHLSGESEIEEEVKDTEKTVSIKNTGKEGKSASVVVKLLIYGPKEMTVTLADSDDWTPVETADGVYIYYYNHVLAPQESTSNVVASVADIPKEADLKDFEVIVLQESQLFTVDDEGFVEAPDGWADFPKIKA